MSATYKLPLVLEEQPEGGYTVTCPLLPGLITEGDTIQEVMVNVQDALVAYIELHEDLGRPLPAVLQPVASHAAADCRRHIFADGISLPTDKTLLSVEQQSQKWRLHGKKWLVERRAESGRAAEIIGRAGGREVDGQGARLEKAQTPR